MDTHRGGVDNLVGGAAQGRKQTHLSLDAVHKSTGALEGMRAAVGFVAAHQCLRAGLEEDDAIDNARALELFERGIKRAEERTRAHVHADSQSVHARSRVIRHHADERGQHRRRQVVDDVPVKVFECAGGTGTTAPE